MEAANRKAEVLVHGSHDVRVPRACPEYAHRQKMRQTMDKKTDQEEKTETQKMQGSEQTSPSRHEARAQALRSSPWHI
jgi:hypothetical protein